jgi:multidrug resistance efflux pump
MHPNPRRVLPVILVLLILGAAAWYFFGRSASADTGVIAASGTIEATEINISPELGGRVKVVHVNEGDVVKAGDRLIEFDTSLLEAQRAQAEAVLKATLAAAQAAQAAQVAAQANFDLLAAGPSAEQLAVAQTVVDKAQVAVDAAREAYDGLSEAARDTTQGQTLKTQLDTAIATLDNALAQYELAEAGARPQQMEAAQAQVDATQAQLEAARAQAEAAQAALSVLDVQLGKLTLKAPADGVVLARSIEPGEMAVPGATLLVIADLGRLTLTVYVPEDRYGNVGLGQTAAITVDSFAGQSFEGTVTYIADRAEFTPRNVQTAEGRRTTVFAVRLSLDNPEGRLKPGMPADVVFNP